MTSPQRKAVANYRRRLKRQGMKRLEVRVRSADAPLVRGVVEALCDPRRERETRALLREKFATAPVRGLKALLAAAPLDSIDFKRAEDYGRDVDL